MATIPTDRIYWATDTVIRGETPAPSWYDPADTLEFSLGEDYRSAPLRVWLDAAVSRAVVSGVLSWSVDLPAGEIVALFPPEDRKTLRWQLRIRGDEEAVVQGQVILLPAFDDQAPPPPVPPPDYYLTAGNSPRLVLISALTPAPGEAIGFAGDGAITTLDVGGGAAPDISGPAAEALSALRVVTRDNGGVIYAELVPHQAHRALGFLTSSVAVGATAIAPTFGEFSDNSWDWNMTKPIWLGAHGALTQTPPTSGYLRVVAAPISPTSILFEAQPPIIL